MAYGVDDRFSMRFGRLLWEGDSQWMAHALSCVIIADYVTLLESKTAGRQYLKDWHLVQAFPNDPVYTCELL